MADLDINKTDDMQTDAEEIKIEGSDNTKEEEIKVEGSDDTAEEEIKIEETPDPDPHEKAEDEEEGASSEEETDDSSEDSDDTGCADENETEEAGKTSMFGRRKRETEKFQKQIEELTDLLKRNRAEFENFRKRTDKEKASMYIIGARDIVEKILPVVDSFERGLAQAPEDDAFAEGMKLVYKQLMTALTDLGVAPIEAVGKEFDPDFHNAVMHVEDENYGENIVVEEFQKGYTYKDFVVRHSMVKVAN